MTVYHAPAPVFPKVVYALYVSVYDTKTRRMVEPIVRMYGDNIVELMYDKTKAPDAVRRVLNRYKRRSGLKKVKHFRTLYDFGWHYHADWLNPSTGIVEHLTLEFFLKDMKVRR